MTNLSSFKKHQTNTPMQLVTVTAPLCSFGFAKKESQQDQRLGESAVVHCSWLEPLHRIAGSLRTVLASAPLHLLILTNFYLT